jgi:hypothetical protein
MEWVCSRTVSPRGLVERRLPDHQQPPPPTPPNQNPLGAASSSGPTWSAPPASSRPSTPSPPSLSRPAPAASSSRASTSGRRRPRGASSRPAWSRAGCERAVFSVKIALRGPLAPRARAARKGRLGRRSLGVCGLPPCVKKTQRGKGRPAPRCFRLSPRGRLSLMLAFHSPWSSPPTRNTTAATARPRSLIARPAAAALPFGKLQNESAAVCAVPRFRPAARSLFSLLPPFWLSLVVRLVGRCMCLCRQMAGVACGGRGLARAPPRRPHCCMYVCGDPATRVCNIASWKEPGDLDFGFLQMSSAHGSRGMQCIIISRDGRTGYEVWASRTGVTEHGKGWVRQTEWT